MIDEDAITVCPICGMFAQGDAPHGFGQPCPQKEEVDRAFVAKLEAERLVVQQSGQRVRDLVDGLLAYMEQDRNRSERSE